MITTPDAMDIALGGVVRQLRKSKKISQSELGAALGISFQQIQKYERGANRISFSALVKMAATLGHTASELIAYVEGGHPDDKAADVIELEGLFRKIGSAHLREAVIELARAAAEDLER
jgi:transcriptional regulator with XRE-family HTH domain